MQENTNETRWRLVEREALFESKWLTLSKNSYELPDSSHLPDFYIVEEMDGAIVIPITPERNLVVVRQFRPAVGDFTYDFPAGYAEPHDDSLLTRAKMELLEETGYAANEWYHAGQFYAAPHRLQKMIHCFVALGAKAVSNARPETTEFIRFQEMSPNEVYQLIVGGEFRCGTCIAALFHAFLISRVVRELFSNISSS